MTVNVAFKELWFYSDAVTDIITVLIGGSAMSLYSHLLFLSIWMHKSIFNHLHFKTEKAVKCESVIIF